jgi:hypothetical protein
VCAGGLACRVLALMLTGVASLIYPSVLSVGLGALDLRGLLRRLQGRRLRPRLGNPLFRKLMAMWCVYGVLFVLLCLNAIAEYTPPRTANGTLPEPGANATLLDGFCTFYVKPPASIPIVVYDLIFTSTLVNWFVKPLIEARKNSLRCSGSEMTDRVMEKALTGARITLLASFLNFMSIVLFPMVRHLRLPINHAAVLRALSVVFCAYDVR